MDWNYDGKFKKIVEMANFSPHGSLPPASTRMDEPWSLKYHSASPAPQLKTSSYATV